MFAYMIGQCAACHNMIHFNPHKVPSLLVGGERVQICRSCAEKWNRMHPENARPILEGAYDPCPEEELYSE